MPNNYDGDDHIRGKTRTIQEGHFNDMVVVAVAEEEDLNHQNDMGPEQDNGDYGWLWQQWFNRAWIGSSLSIIEAFPA